MIKSVTTNNFKDVKRNVRQMSAEVTIDGSGREVMHELLGILDAFEKQCPEILLMALQLYMEGKTHDC